MKNLNVKIQNYKIKRGDLVKVLLGKDNGKEGKVLRVDHKSGKVTVEGVNMVKRHVRSMQGMEGGIVDLAKPLDISNIALICPNCKQVTRVGMKVNGDAKQRVCKKCQGVI